MALEHIDSKWAFRFSMLSVWKTLYDLHIYCVKRLTYCCIFSLLIIIINLSAMHIKCILDDVLSLFSSIGHFTHSTGIQSSQPSRSYKYIDMSTNSHNINHSSHTGAGTKWGMFSIRNCEICSIQEMDCRINSTIVPKIIYVNTLYAQN